MDASVWNLSYLNFRYSAKKRLFKMLVLEMHGSGTGASADRLIEQALRPAIRNALGRRCSESVEDQVVSANEFVSTISFRAARRLPAQSTPSIVLKLEERLNGSSARIEIDQYDSSIAAVESLYRAIRAIPGLEVGKQAERNCALLDTLLAHKDERPEEIIATVRVAARLEDAK